MNAQNDLHPVQAKILRVLLFKPSARFSELNGSGLSNDHFTFHINRLVEIGLVEKLGGKYQLTTAGKEFANRLDTDTTQIERQAKTAILIVAVRQEGDQPQYLMQQRLKQPYFGFHGFISGKVRWGEEILMAADRELMEETGLRGGKKTLMGIEHKMDCKGEMIQEDKYFYIVKTEEPEGELTVDFEGGKSLWLTEKEILELPKLFDDISAILGLVNGRKFAFLEKKYQIDEY